MIWHGRKSWNGVGIVARGRDPIETRRGLPGDPDATQSRYIEAAIAGIVIGWTFILTRGRARSGIASRMPTSAMPV